MTTSPFRTRYGIEPLEQRIAPATVQLLGGLTGSKNWSDPTIWSGGSVPTAADDVILDTIGSTVTIQVDIAAAAKSLVMSSDEILNINNSLTLAGAGAAPSIFTNGSLGGGLSIASGSTYTVTGNFNFTGALVGTGTLDIASGAVLTVPFGEPDLGAKIRVAGSLNQGNAYLDFTSDVSQLEVLAGGIYSVSTNGYNFREYAPNMPIGATFQPGATFRSLGGSFSTASVPVTLTGATIDIVDGNLVLDAFPVLTNPTINIAAGKGFSFVAPNATINGTLTKTGDGDLRFGAGAITANPAGITVNANQVFWEGDHTIAGGAVQFTGNLTVSSSEPNLAAKVTVAGQLTHHNAYLDFITNNAELVLPAGSAYSVNTNGYQWREYATDLPVGVRFESGSTFRSLGGSFHTSSVPLQMSNATIDIVDGTLNLNASPILANPTINIASGKAFAFVAGNAVISGTLTKTGVGDLRFSGGAITADPSGLSINANQVFWEGDHTILGGTVQLTGNLTIASSEPNLATKLTVNGQLNHYNAYLDFVTDSAELVLPNGSSYSLNNNGYAWREYAPNMPVGVKFETGSVFQIAGGSFHTSNVPLQMTNATIDVVDGTLNLNATPILANPTINIAAEKTFNFVAPNAAISGTLTKTGAGDLRFSSGAITANAAGLSIHANQIFWEGDHTILGGEVQLTGNLTIASSEPNLATKLIVNGQLNHHNAYLDFITNSAELVLPNGSSYTVNTNGYAWREYAPDLPVGLVFESGSTFRITGGSFYTGTVPLQMTGATIDVVDGALNLNAAPLLTNLTINIAAGKGFNFNQSNPTLFGTLTKTGTGNLVFGGGVINAGAGGLTVNANEVYIEGDPTLTGAPMVFTGDARFVFDSPNIGTKVTVQGDIFHGNAYLDFVTDNAELVLPSGSTYSLNNNGYNWREYAPNLPVGVKFEAGSVFQITGGSFYTSSVPLQMTSATIDVVDGFLGLNFFPLLTDLTVNVAATKTFNFNQSSPTIIGTLTKTGLGNLAFAGGTITAGAAGLTVNANEAFIEGDVTLAGGPIVFRNNLNIVYDSPNLATKVTVEGDIFHFGSYLDFVSDNAELIVPAGSTYHLNTNGYSWREYAPNLPVGVVIQSGGSLKIESGSFHAGGTPFSNAGTAHASGGHFNVGISGGVLTGTWKIDAGFSINNTAAPILTNNGTAEIAGAFNGFAPSVNSGILRLLNGNDFSTGGSFSNTGTLELSAGSVLSAASFSQPTVGQTTFHIAGTAQANVGRLQISGAATLGGFANLVFDDPFAPAAGNGFVLADYQSATGNFKEGNGFFLGRQKSLEAVTDTNSFRVNSLIDAADLTTTAVTHPASGTAGSLVTVNYTVQNTGTFSINAPEWVDSIFLSRDGTLDSSDLLIKRVPHTGALNPGETYNGSTTFALPGAIPADYRIIVVADSRGIVPDADRASNTLASASPLALTIPTLTEGVPFDGTIGANQDLYFRVAMPASKGRTFTLTTPNSGTAGFSVELGDVPGRFDGNGFSAGNTTFHEVALPGGTAGDFYIHVHGTPFASNTPFTLFADGLDFGITSSSVHKGSNADLDTATVTTTVKGTSFSKDTVFSLEGAESITAYSVVLRDSSTAFVSFKLQNKPVGTYSLQATDGVTTSTLSNTFEVVNTAPGILDYSISAPSYIRAPYRGVEVTLTYKNIGDTDLPAPYFSLIPTNTKMKLEGRTDFLGGAIGILATSPDGPAGILAPGKTYTIRIPYVPTTNVVGTEVDFKVQVLGNDTAPIDWDVVKESYRPDSMPTAAWDQVFANFKASVGDSSEQFHRVLIENANYLSQFGPVGYDITPLIGFELNQADDFGTISSRYNFGMFGYGGDGPFHGGSSVDEFGLVTIETAGGSRVFKPNPAAPSTFLPVGIDETAQLSVGPESGSLILTELSGAKTKFRANGSIEYTEDSNGNRLNGSYDINGRLTSVASSFSGDVTTYAYNAAGLVSTVTDPVGRVTNYTYDAEGHVLQVSNLRGTVSYTYSATTPHAVATKTESDGVVTSYNYDARGRVTSITSGTGADAQTRQFSYDTLGNSTITDSGNEVTQLFRNAFGQITRIIDPLGNSSFSTFDSHGRLVSSTDAQGVVTTNSYLRADLINKITYGDGSTTAFEYNARNEVTQLISAGGDISSFAYDAKGNPTTQAGADGSFLNQTYDAKGRVATATDARGITLTNTYNTTGQLTRRDYSNGEFVTYTYDAHRNLLTATDAEGTTTFTYNSADLMTSVSYPNGKSISFTYDAANRRSSVTENGFTVNYSYDAQGRLDNLKDGSNALIVDYGYDERGLLVSEARGNGSSSQYTYDAAGQVQTITHRDAANAIIENLVYERDAVGRVTTMQSQAGTTTYGYDLIGQLISVTLPGGREIDYAYDSDGNRTVVNDNGVATTYSTSAGDRYSTIGGVTPTYDPSGRLVTLGSSTYSYDAAGRLIGVVSGGDTVAYDYDALGNRIGIVTNGVRTDFTVDPAGIGNVAGETTSGVSTHYAIGIGLEGQFTGASASYFHEDAIGNTLLLTGNAGAVQNTYSYLPYGEIASQSGTTANRFTFNGKYGVQDDFGHQYSMRGREYDASIGRFTSRDPVGFGGADTNLYRFVGNDPVNSIDPIGLFEMNEVSMGLSGEIAVGGGVNGGIGLAINTTDWLDSGPYLSGGGSVGVGGGLTAAVGVSEQVAGWSTQANTSYGFVGGAAGIDTSTGSINSAQVSFSPLPSKFGATVSESYTLKLSPRGALNALGALGDFGYDAGYNAADALGRAKSALEREWGIPDGSLPDSAKPGGSTDGIYNAAFQAAKKAGLDDAAAAKAASEAAGKSRPGNGPYTGPGSGSGPGGSGPYSGPGAGRGPGSSGGAGSGTVGPADPNQMIGPGGFGAEAIFGDIFTQPVRFGGYVADGGPFGYTILFENKPTAQAPAQVVTVTQTLDEDLDLSTFEFVKFGWGDFEVFAPAGLTNWETRVDAKEALGVFVDIDAQLDPNTRVLTVIYTSIDPETGDIPLDPFSGFLPPNLTAPEGDGFIGYSVSPKSGLTSDTDFTAVATIIFDFEAPLNTPTVTNTLDSTAPVSTVTAFPVSSVSRGTFQVNWTAADEAVGSGLKETIVYYRDNNGPLVEFYRGTDTSKVFTGGELGHTYTFFSSSLDNVDNVETISNTPDATIAVSQTLLAVGTKRVFTDSDGDTYTVTLSGPGTLSAVLLDPDGDNKGPLDRLILTGSTVKSKVTITVKRAPDGLDADKLPDGDGIVTLGDFSVTGDLASFTAKTIDLTMEGIAVSGTIGTVTVRDLSAAQPTLFLPGITAGGTPLSKVKLTVNARNIGDGFTIDTGTGIKAIKAAQIGEGLITGATLDALTTTVGAMNADLDIEGAVKAITIKTSATDSDWQATSFGKISAAAGGVGAHITTAGAVGPITIKGGSLTGDLVARNFGKIAITNGNFSGTIHSDTLATTLLKVPALASLTVTGGDITGDITVRGAVGAITAKTAKTAVPGVLAGGNFDGAYLTAIKIAAISAAKDVRNSTILAGADLGSDHAFGGSDTAADTLAGGTIGKVSILGEAVAAIIGAGLSSTDSILKNPDDSIIGGLLSKIGSVIVKGAADSDSYFAAGAYGKTSIAGAPVVPATDSRFLI